MARMDEREILLSDTLVPFEFPSSPPIVIKTKFLLHIFLDVNETSGITRYRALTASVIRFLSSNADNAERHPLKELKALNPFRLFSEPISSENEDSDGSPFLAVRNLSHLAEFQGNTRKIPEIRSWKVFSSETVRSLFVGSWQVLVQPIRGDNDVLTAITCFSSIHHGVNRCK